MKEEHAALRESESGLRTKWSRLEEMSGQQGAELKQLREQVAVLEGENKDSDMKMELATQRKDREIKVIFIFFKDFVPTFLLVKLRFNACCKCRIVYIESFKIKTNIWRG